jgi:hypothetical protein
MVRSVRYVFELVVGVIDAESRNPTIEFVMSDGSDERSVGGRTSFMFMGRAVRGFSKTGWKDRSNDRGISNNHGECVWVRTQILNVVSTGVSLKNTGSKVTSRGLTCPSPALGWSAWKGFTSATVL